MSQFDFFFTILYKNNNSNNSKELHLAWSYSPVLVIFAFDTHFIVYKQYNIFN